MRLLENPKYHLPGVTLFHGAVDLDMHDRIDIALGRGLLTAIDEAFTIGFTMGSTKRVRVSRHGCSARWRGCVSGALSIQ